MICSSALGVWGAAALTTDASAKPGSVESFQRLSEWHGLSFWFSYSLLGFVILVLPLTSSLCPVCHLLMSLCLVKLVFFSLIRCQFICSVPPPVSPPVFLVFLPVFFSVSLLFHLFVFFILLNPGLLPIFVSCYYPFFVVFLSVFAFCVFSVLQSSALLKASLFVSLPCRPPERLALGPHYFCYT